LHLQFVDDTLLLGEKYWANIRALKGILILFEEILGQKEIFYESMFMGVDVPNSWLKKASLVLACKIGDFSFTYPGLPIRVDYHKLQFWYPLLD